MARLYYKDARMTVRIFDDRQRELVFLRPPQRVVSLVPSDTDNVLRLGGRLVGRTRYCEAEAEIVGGTKDVDVDAVARLLPDLILANQEENTQQHLERLAQLGFPVLVAFPRTVGEGVAHLARLSKILRSEARALLKDAYAAAQPVEAPALRAFVPIWMEPLMTLNGQTYIHDALRLAGAANVFADRERRYPLAADLGQAVPRPSGTRDTRYPRVTWDEVRARAPQVVLLPDEPHPFSEADAAAVQRELPEARVVRLAPGANAFDATGRDLCWYGAQAAQGIPRLRRLIDSLR